MTRILKLAIASLTVASTLGAVVVVIAPPATAGGVGISVARCEAGGGALGGDGGGGLVCVGGQFDGYKIKL